MFNDRKAPFFHFAHSIDFPILDKDFTDRLATIYQERTNQTIDKDILYGTFERLSHTPMYIRLIIEDMIINPALSLKDATTARLSSFNENTDYYITWKSLKELDKLLLQRIARGLDAPLYSIENRKDIANFLGVNNITNSNIQYSMSKLEKKDLLTKSASDLWQINDSSFKTWIEENTF